MGGHSDGPNGGLTPDRSDHSIYQALVELSEELIDADLCEFLTEEHDQLVVLASTDPRPERSDRSYPVLTGIPGRAYSSGTACVIDDQHDVRRATSVEPSESSALDSYRSVCCVPVDGHGLLLAKARRSSAFTEGDLTLVERLAEMVQSAHGRSGTEHPIDLNGESSGTREYSELLEQIGDILSHDLKNPLNVAQGNLELAQESGEGEFLEKTASALNRIETLVDEVVFLARTGEFVDQLTWVDLQNRAEDAWGNVQTQDAGLIIEGSIEFISSERGVSHLLENLIENAISHAGPEVTVGIGALDDGFYVEDDGPGIPTAERDRIFERGYSLAGETSGLGLPIVNRIVDAHGWTLGVEASSAGGARFVVTGVEFSEA